MTGYDLNGTVVLTTDQLLYESEVAAGNPWLKMSGFAQQLGNRSGVIGTYGEPPNPGDVKFHPTVFLMGHAAGDRVFTPYFVAPFGSAIFADLPKVIGPLNTTFTINLDEVYSEESRSASTAAYGPREGIVPGNEIRYAGVFGARVDQVSGGNATITITDLGEGHVYSSPLGIDFYVEDVDDGRVILKPALSKGDTFTTAGCQLPGSVIPPGHYRVVDDQGELFRLYFDLGPMAAALQRPLRFELQLHEVRPQGPNQETTT